MTAPAVAAPRLPARRGQLGQGIRTMLRFGLRSQRWWLVGVGYLGFLSTLATGVTWFATAGRSTAAQASFGHEVALLGAQLAYMIPLPLHPELAAGYIWWKGLTWMTLIFAAWGLAAGTGAVRSDEERGLMEIWLAAPFGRLRLLLCRGAAFGLAAAVAAIAAGLGTALALDSAKAAGSGLALVEQCLPLLGIGLVCFGVGLVAAQLAVTRRGAASLGAAVLLALYVIDAMARVNSTLVGVAVISPFHLADLTTAMVPGGRFDGGATLALFVIAAALTGVAALGFQHRDLLGSVLGGSRGQAAVTWAPSENPLLRLPVLSTLWRRRYGLIGWLAGTMIGAALYVSLARGVSGLLTSVPAFRVFLIASGTNDPALAIVTSFWYGTACLVGAAYAITQVSHWASDDAEGRLEMEIAQPVPRWRVVAERFLCLAVGATLIAAAGSLVTAAVLPSQGISVEAGPLLLASVLLVPLTVSFGALGALVIARFPRVAVPVLSVIAVVSFYLPVFAPLFNWPGWSLDLSLFHLYGTPLTTGVFWTGLWIMLGIVVVGFGGAMVAMGRREVGR